MEYQDLKILTDNEPVLRQISRPAEIVGDNLHQLCQRMTRLMREKQGAGLAAPQVGLSIQFFIINENGKVREFVNPVVRSMGIEQEKQSEGCLSFPGEVYQVTRAKKIRVTAMNLSGGEFELEVEGWIARVIQHEYDHLLGLNIPDRAEMEASIERKQFTETARRVVRDNHGLPKRLADSDRGYPPKGKAGR